MDELKPCPFCGDKNIKVRITKGYHYVIGCSTVHCICVRVSGKPFVSEKDAIETWNRRAEDAD